MEAARLQANELARPWGHSADTPDIAWRQRRPIDAEDRVAFMESVQQLEQEARQERQNDLLPGMPLGPKDMASIRREAISRALVEHGLLLFRRRRSTLPLKRVIWANVPQGAHGRARIEIPLALNELEGAWELCFTDAATSVAETVKVKVKTESGTRQRAL